MARRVFQSIITGAAVLAAGAAHAHERWILTPEEIARYSAGPRPRIFTEFTPEGLVLLIGAISVMAVLFYMHYFAPPPLLAKISGGRRRHGAYVPTLLRFFAAWTLLSSAFGMEPRVGVDPMMEPSMLAPDLLLSQLSGNWLWLHRIEGFLGIWLLSGVWCRVAAVAALHYVWIACALFGEDMMAYAPIWIGVCVYLIVRGAGRFAIRAPSLGRYNMLSLELAQEPLRYAQLFLRVMSGLNFMYLGIRFKVMEPELALGIITQYQVPILSWAPETAVFLMALVEVCGGLLILCGIVIRPVAIVLLGAFLFFAACLPESVMSHALFYGVMGAFILCGPGRLREHGRYGAARGVA